MHLESALNVNTWTPWMRSSFWMWSSPHTHINWLRRTYASKLWENSWRTNLALMDTIVAWICPYANTSILVPSVNVPSVLYEVTGLFGQEFNLELSVKGHSPIGPIQKCWQQTDLYLGSPSDSDPFWSLEINNYVEGFGDLVKYWVADLRMPIIVASRGVAIVIFHL